MNSSEKDYKKLYLLQNKFLKWWSTLNLPFYLTGGTALHRFYLNYRYSEDLDFFTNNNPLYSQYIAFVKKNIENKFKINTERALFTEDFTRFFVIENDVYLKIELVNDTNNQNHLPINYKFGLIDNLSNILANKLTAIIGRDEPKDVFDIVHIALNYSFNWIDIFNLAKTKAAINEIDVEQRLCSFPIEWIKNIDWVKKPVNLDLFQKNLKQIADDFLLGRNNSICSTIISINNATPTLCK
jgi:predicted nucleotidyltransferase component of viral defense system